MALVSQVARRPEPPPRHPLALNFAFNRGTGGRG
jgi:hypothetical protein